MAFDVKTVQAAQRLGQHLSGKPWYSGVGIAGESNRPILVVYLRRRPSRDDSGIPQSWEQIPVRAEHMGKILPAQLAS
jgi:hypothetical protein